MANSGPPQIASLTKAHHPMSRRIHIAVVLPTLHGGGAEFAARQWVRSLTRVGHIVTVYLYDRVQPDVSLPPGITIHRLSPWFGRVRPVALVVWLAKRIRVDRPDVILSVLTYTNVAVLITPRTVGRRKVPVVLSEHNMPSLLSIDARARDRLVFWLARRLYRRAAGALAVSHAVAGDLVSAYKVPPDRLFVVPHPIVGKTRFRERDTQVALPTRLHVAFVGRQADFKRPSLFLEVVADLAARGIDVTGTVIGDGPRLKVTEMEARRRGLTLRFAGWQEPWWDAARDVDCMIVTSRAEGFAIVLVEAAMAGIPCVASSRALGVADAIIPGVTGDLAMGDTPADYADAVLRAIAFGDRGAEGLLEGWLDRFSEDRSAALLESLLRTVAFPTECRER